MAKTGTQIVTEICDVCGKALTALSISGAELQDRVLTYANWGQRRIARSYNFREMQKLEESAATVDGTKTYPMITGTSNLGLVRPKDISSIRLIDSENSIMLRRWSQRRFDKRFPYPENYSEGRPTIYARWGNNLVMYRIPDDAYTLHIRYTQWAADLTTSTTSDFDEKDQLIIAAGVLDTYLALQEYDDAKIWAARYLGTLTDEIRSIGDDDWQPVAYSDGYPDYGYGYDSGTPWLDPYGGSGDPLYNYPG